MPWYDIGDPTDPASTGWPANDTTSLMFARVKQAIQEARELEKHFHTRERWCGISADQSGNDWALEAGLNPFVVASGNADFGAAIKVLGTDDTPTIAGFTRFDMHRITVTDFENPTVWVVRIIWDDTDAATGEAAGRYTDVVIMAADAGPPVRPQGVPIDILMPRLLAGTDMVWVKAKNATNADELDFFVGIHDYDDPL